jgi:hypothetical protein
MTAQSFSSDYFDDPEAVRDYARERVTSFIAGQYPDLNAVDTGKRSAIIEDGAELVAEAIVAKIDAGEPIDLLALSAGLIRKFLTGRGFKASASTEAVRRKSPRRQAVTADLVTEDSVASAFTLQRAGELRYCGHAGRWYEWTGNVWRMNETGIVLHQVRELTRAMSAGATDKIQATVNKVSFASGAERFCKVDPKFAVTSAHWDQDPMLLGTPSGTVDLRTGELRPSDQADGITKSTAVAPAAPGAACPLWLKFLQEASGETPRWFYSFSDGLGMRSRATQASINSCSFMDRAATVSPYGSTPSRASLANITASRRSIPSPPAATIDIPPTLPRCAAPAS